MPKLRNSGRTIQCICQKKSRACCGLSVNELMAKYRAFRKREALPRPKGGLETFLAQHRNSFAKIFIAYGCAYHAALCSVEMCHFDRCV